MCHKIEFIQKPGNCLLFSKYMDLLWKVLDSPSRALSYTLKVQQHFLCITRNALGLMLHAHHKVLFALHIYCLQQATEFLLEIVHR